MRFAEGISDSIEQRFDRSEQAYEIHAAIARTLEAVDIHRPVTWKCRFHSGNAQSRLAMCRH
jgi:hypothetical protein